MRTGIFSLMQLCIDFACAPAGLLELADSYCEKELKKHCERLIWQSVTVDNVATLMTLASKYRTSVSEDPLYVCACRCVVQERGII